MQNYTGFVDAALDRAIERARSGPDCSVEARRPAFDELDRILSEAQPYTFGFARNTLTAASNDLREFMPGSFGTGWNVGRWWLAK